ncbi:beta-glucosidase BglX [Granulicella sibirica]|uniref:beta-glucosidase n=1 Tax=Granulicella sibirica TaxID=2479048 RepID=A0A4Q0STJ7_9BACT|nr:beta-glucosidase BglX [Granulicella sibirica]RXH54303.1 Beta-glucosidase [Granulicella sibirica]
MRSSRGFTRSHLRLAVVAGLSLSLAAVPLASRTLAQAAVSSNPKTNVNPEALRFANDLLKKMTLEEKIGQMSQTAMNTPDKKAVDDGIRKGQIGSLLFITDATEINRLQKIAVDESRLHIPLIVGFDVIHGFRTIYPVPIAMAASWEPSVAETAQRMAAREASSDGVRWTFAPMVDIARDPRWGRIMEGAGEDPYLGSRMAEAQVRGFQGDLGPDHILACVKHFAGYGAAVGGRDYDSSNISDDQLWNVYLPPFKAAVDAGAGSLMSAYMDLNSVPATGNKFLLHDVLREQWGFKGFVVSDWDSVKSLTVHGFSADDRDAATRAVNAGVDMEMTSHTFRDNLAAAVKQGTVKESTIDDAVRDILVAKYRLGLFKNPYVDTAKIENISAAQRAATRKAATQTAVLLRNEGGLLPLTKAPASIAVIGPLANAKADTMGSWSLAGHPADTVTVLEGIKNKFGNGTNIRSTTGVEIFRDQPSIFDDQFPDPKPVLTTDEAKKAEFDKAIAMVKDSEMTVLVLGEAQTMSGERASRSSLTLPGKQQELLEAAVATGKPIVLVLLNARPLDITWASAHVPAILDVWYPGTEGGNAVADLLSGAANPGGKLPVSWPRNVGQVPIYYGDNLTQIPRDPETRYWDGSSAPLYPFGYGLSYSTFTLGNMKMSSTSLKKTGEVTVSVDVQNTSATAGDEVVQLYTHQRAGSASRPVRELKGFRRVQLGPNETKTVTLTLKAEQLGFWSPAKRIPVLEAGAFDLWIGTSSQAEMHSEFTLEP